LLPEPNQIPDFLKKKKLFSIDFDKKFMRQGSWSRPITHPSFFIEDKLIWMNKHGIDHAVIITLSQLYCNGWGKQDALDTIRFQNNFNASIQDDYPNKFTCGFVIQPLYIDDALKEMERCVNKLGLKVLCLPTHFLSSESKWTSIADECVDPIFALADKYSLSIQIHPYDGEKMVSLENKFWRFHLVWMLAQCADAFHIFTLRGLPNKYSNIRTCFAHGCMLSMANYGRRLQGHDGRPDLFRGAEDPRNFLSHKAVFFDTLVHDVYTLELMKKRVGVSQIIVGLDDPYPLGEMEGVGNSYPGRLIEDAVKQAVLNKEEAGKIWGDNVLKWLDSSDLK